MIKKKEPFAEKNKRDTKITENSFILAVKKASLGGKTPKIEQEKLIEASFEIPQETDADHLLRAQDELMRAKEAKNETTCESEKFRRDEKLDV